MAGHRTTRLLGQNGKEIELFGGQVDSDSVDLYGTSASVDQDSSCIKARLNPAAAGHGPDSGGQLPHTERLDDIVIGTEFQADDPIRLVPPGRGNDDRDVGVSTQVAQHVKAVTVGQAQVKENEVDVPGGAENVRGIGNMADVKTISAQALEQWLEDRRIILDHQDLHGVIVAWCRAIVGRRQLIEHSLTWT